MRIKLGKRDMFTIVDDMDYFRSFCYRQISTGFGFYCSPSEVSWQATGGRDNWYAGSRKMINGIRYKMLLHRLIAEAPPGKCVDHINRNRLDNRLENLRLCDPIQNHYNRTPRQGKASQFKGVYPVSNKKKEWRQSNPWRAVITISKKQVDIGVFKTELEAAFAYDKAAREAFGEFALTNEMLGLMKCI